jgi:trehalose 6-phosphate synthase
LSRLVVVSNRVTNPSDGAVTGGLAVAVEAALKERGGLWFGWSGNVAQRRARRPRISGQKSITYATIDLSQKDFDAYYLGFANQTLWPAFHYRLDLIAYDQAFYAAYREVNDQFARHLMPLLKRSDIIWVHDYQLVLVGSALKERGCRAPIGFFLHIPFPAASVMVAVPRHEELVRALFDYDLIGFQTANDQRQFEDYVVQKAGGSVSKRGIVKAFGRTVRIGAFPVGIETDVFAAYTQTPEARRRYQSVRRSLYGRDMIIGVDRLDYTKGIAERLRAYQRLLISHTEYRNNLVLMQVAPPSRTQVPGYRETTSFLETTTGQINGQLAEFDWVPIRYLNKAYSQQALVGMYMAARVGLVTPLRDGMNLVAKEYVAAQDPDDPGVLILSAFAGAARQLAEALIVNPYDIETVAETIHRALRMSRDERHERWQAMMRTLQAEDVTAWRRNFVDTLQAAKTTPVVA